MTHFFNFAPIVFGIGEARHFISHVLINTQQYWCMHDILPAKGTCSESCGLFSFWEISDNISLKVHDRDIVAVEH